MKNREYTEAYWVPNPLTPNQAINIDLEICIGCKRCVNACRTDVLLPTLENSQPPCTLACPAGIDIKRQLAFIARGQYQEALKLIKESIPLPMVCSRVCPRFCEKKCGRTGLEGPVAINMTKRFVADMDLNQGGPYVPEVRPATGQRVAIVGSGPAGLTAAYFLSLAGHAVSIFESRPKLGGLLRYGVPDHRLPKAILDKEVESITGICREVKTNVTLGKDFTIESLKAQGFDAILLAMGAQGILKLNVPGEDLAGVYSGVAFLRDLNSEKKIKIGQKVVLVGGGMVAVDAAQSALRLGAGDVTIVCLETRETMPAYPEDVALAEEEGIKIIPSWGVKRIIGTGGKVSGVELKACTSAFDKSGKFNPAYDESKTRTLDADTVIVAIGQTPDLSFLGSGIKAGRVIDVNNNYATNAPGIYAVGDIVTGPKTVIEACAAGHNAATAINKQLRGRKVTVVEKPQVRGELEYFERQEYADSERQRTAAPLRKAEERKHTFAEIELGVSEEAVRTEAGRCFACGQQPVVTYPDECWFCGCCVEVCPVPGAIRIEFPLNQRVVWKRKATGEYFRIGMKNPPPPNTRPPIM